MVMIYNFCYYNNNYYYWVSYFTEEADLELAIVWSFHVEIYDN